MVNGPALSTAGTAIPVFETPVCLASGDPALISWLHELNVDAHSIDILARREEYTKSDLLEFVSREDLTNAGLRYDYDDDDYNATVIQYITLKNWRNN